jgi:cytoskeletal protein RodZ
MSSLTTALVFVAVMLFLVLGITVIWWLQTTTAERAREANPTATGRTDRLASLSSERRAARRVARVVAPIAGIAFVAAVLAAVLSR